MPAAAKSLSTAALHLPGAPAQPAADGELFASLLAGGVAPTDAGADDGNGLSGPEPALGDDDKLDDDGAPLDAAMLLPLLDQQRLLQPVIAPAAKAVAVGAVEASVGAALPARAPGVKNASAVAMPLKVPVAEGGEGAQQPTFYGDGTPEASADVPAPKTKIASDDAASPKAQPASTPRQPRIGGPSQQTLASPPAPSKSSISADQAGEPQSESDVPASPPLTAVQAGKGTSSTRAPRSFSGKIAVVTDGALPTEPGETPSRPRAATAEASTATATVPEAKAAAVIAVDMAVQAERPASARARLPMAVFLGETAKVAAGDDGVKLSGSTAGPVPADGQTAATLDPRANPVAAATAPHRDIAEAAPAQPDLGAALADKVLDLSKDGAWIDRLARDIAGASGSDGAMRFRLAPEHLGSLRVEITQSEQGARIHLHASSEAAQQALSDAQPKLAAEARAQGVRIADTQVSYGGDSSQASDNGARQRAATPQDVPLRAVRTASPPSTSAPAPQRRRNDRYA